MTEIQALVKQVEKPPQRVPQGGSRERGREEVRGLYEYGWKDFFKDCYDYCRTHSFREIAAAVWRSCLRHPVEFATLIISLISLGVSSAGLAIAILSPQ